MLGLRLLSGPADDPIVFAAGGDTLIVLSEMPDRVPPPYPVVSFLVTGIEDVVAGLEARGVEFGPLGPASFAGRAGVPRGHVMDFGPVRSAFLRDTEGNLLALNEMVE